MVTGTEVVFWICAVLAILGAVGLITFSKPVYSALCLALVMVSLAVIYASLGAPFLMAVQIIVYTGAILMLFLFVIMLVGVDTHDSFTETLKGHRVAAGLAGVGVLTLLTLAVTQVVLGSPAGLDAANAGGNVEGLASLIFSRYVIAFECTAALLITAAVAAMVLAYPEKVKKKIGQVERAAQRLEAFTKSGQHPGPKPSSGVFARHNSIATPALLPDGTVAEESVSRILADRVAIASAEDLWAPHDEILAAIESEEDDIFELEEAKEETEAEVSEGVPTRQDTPINEDDQDKDDSKDQDKEEKDND
jgi:NADH-quinone oxidoreductase subunit J